MANQDMHRKEPDFIHVNLLPIEYRMVKKDYSFLLDLRVLLSTIALLASMAAYGVGQSFFRANIESKKAAFEKIQAEIGIFQR